MACYRFFDCYVDSDFPLRLPRAQCVKAGEAPVPIDLAIHRCEQPPVDSRWVQEPPVYESRRVGAAAEARTKVQESGGWVIWSFQEGSVFFVSRREIRILPGKATPRQLEVRLLGPVVSYWLESRGIIVLHGSVVALRDRALALVGAHGSGKTTLAASLMTQGANLLSDDLAAIDVGEEVQVRPAYPRLRMRADIARSFVADFETELPRVLPGGDKFLVDASGVGKGRFGSSPLRLDRIFVLRSVATDDKPALEPMDRGEAMIALVGHSFLSRPLEVLADRASRMEALATIVKSVPVLSLRVPRGFENLGRVTSAIFAHLQRSSQSARLPGGTR